MRQAFLILLAFAFCIAVTSGFGLNFWKFRSVIKKEELAAHQKRRHSSQFPDSKPLPVSRVIIQPLDHFDPQVKETYAQRYWVNDNFWKSPDGPVFLYIGGEGSLSENAAETGAYMSFAAKYGALIFAVEHRFYGQSLNDDGLKMARLKHLSSQQALADLANFHLQMSKTYNLTDKNLWISFGGSYPGALSAWFRIKYPHLVHASVASSAPVRALVDFKGYNDVVAKSLTTPVVGGSAECGDMVRTSFQVVDALISKGLLERLSRDFLSCETVKTELDVFTLTSNLAGIFMGVVQYNNIRPLRLNIERVCKIMTKGPDAYSNLVSLNQAFLEETFQNCSDNSWDSFLRQLSNDTLDRMADANMRQWTYQTCAQFGYYQACDDADCLFSHHMTLAPNVDACSLVFGFTSKEVYDSVDFTNAYYGSDQPRGSRIMFVNGLIDPWHALSVLSNISDSELAIVIPGTAHCADMTDDSERDPPELTIARQKISSQIGLWLKESPSGAATAPRKPVYSAENKAAENSINDGRSPRKITKNGVRSFQKL